MKRNVSWKSAVCVLFAGLFGIALAERHESTPWAMSFREFVGAHAESLKDASDRHKKCAKATKPTVQRIHEAAKKLLDDMDSSPRDLDPDRVRQFLTDAEQLTADRQVWTALLKDFRERSEKEVFADWQSVLDSIEDPDLKRSQEARFAKARSISDQEVDRLQSTIDRLNQALKQAQDVGRALQGLDLEARAGEVNTELSTKANDAQARVRDFVAETGSILKLLGG